MKGTLGPYTIEETMLYVLSGPEIKVLLGIVEEGLGTDKNGNITYNSERPIGMSSLQRKLDSQVSPSTVDQKMDSLIDGRFVKPSFPELVKSADGKDVYGRAFRVHPSAQEYMLKIFKA